MAFHHGFYDLLGMQDVLDQRPSIRHQAHVLCLGTVRDIKYWHSERQKCFDMKDKPGIRHAQSMAIGWRECLRVLQSIVYNFFEEHPESADDKEFRYKNCSMSECSDADYWEWLNHGVSNPDLSATR